MLYKNTSTAASATGTFTARNAQAHIKHPKASATVNFGKALLKINKR